MNSLGILASGLFLMLIVMGTAWFIARRIPFYRRELSESGSRELPLDGLRGMAALMVMTYHAALACVWIKTGDWGATQSEVLQPFGSGGVSLFFMLTGYLFWAKARRNGGRMPTRKLWRGRLYRIGPLYLFSLALVLMLALSHKDWAWLALKNWWAMLRWLSLGALDWQAAGNLDLRDFNGGVTWTLHYEWEFYLLLPFIAWLATGYRIVWAAGAICLIYSNPWILFYLCPGLDWTAVDLQACMLFLFGMICPLLFENDKLRSLLNRPSAAGLALLLTVLWFRLNFSHSFSIFVAVGVFPLFFVAAAGNSFFGFLTHPMMCCLGAMCFSLYLLHCIVFMLVFHWLIAAKWTNGSPLVYWLILWGCAVCVTGLCAATYRWIEFPFLSVSHKSRPGGRPTIS